MTEEQLIEAGRAAVVEGLRLWHLDIGDPAPRYLGTPPSDADAKWFTLQARALRWRETIDLIHESVGWGGETPYKGNGRGREWCGMFAGRCWREAGIDPTMLAAFFPSTMRLNYWAHYRDWNQHKNPPPPRGVAKRRVAKLSRDTKVIRGELWNATYQGTPFMPREGDIAVIGDDPKGEPFGRHIVVVTGIDLERGVILTVEGNGWGRGPDGKDREGIIVSERKIGGPGDIVLWVYRPAPGDLLDRST